MWFMARGVSVLMYIFKLVRFFAVVTGFIFIYSHNENLKNMRKKI